MKPHCPTHTRQALDMQGECPICERLIDRAEDARDVAGDWKVGQARYERWLDSIGGSR
jgi:hypothetical protein